MNYEGTIKINKGVAYALNQYLTVEPLTEADCFSEDINYSADYTFLDGVRIVVECCGVQFKENESNLAWTQAILYDPQGYELAFSEVEDEFLGNWTFEEVQINGETNDYSLDVVVED